MAEETKPTRRKRPNTRIKSDFDPTRWAHLVFVLGGFFAAWILTNAIEDVWALIWDFYPQLVSRPRTLTANAAGVGSAALLTIIAWRHTPWFKFVTEVVVEFSQITWPTRAEVRSATGVVIVITLICSVLLFGMDQIWSNMTDLLYGI